MKIDEEKLTEENEELKREALREYTKSLNDLHKERRKKFFIISSIIILTIMIIKIFFGTIELYNIFGYPSSNARYYKLTVNDKQVAVSYTLRRKIPLIPYLVNFSSTYLGNSNIANDDTGPFFYSDDSKKYVININSYKCYYDDIQVECNNSDQSMKETSDEKFSMLTITRMSNPRGVIYQDKFVNDIAPYIKDKGQYHIEITSKQGINETQISFYFNNFKKEN